MIRLSHTAMLPAFPPLITCVVRIPSGTCKAKLLETQEVLESTCTSMPTKAQYLNMTSGTLTKYSWKKAEMANTIMPAHKALQ